MTIPNRTFGIEIEVFGIDQNQAARALHDAGLYAQVQSYNHSRFDGWKIVTDGSIVPSPGYSGGCEVVSPILRGEEGLADLRKACQALSHAGARVNRTCGLHVHVGTNDLTANDVAMILSRYARFESVIDSWMPESRRESRNAFCRSIAPIVNSRINNRSWAQIPDVASQFGRDRYFKINMDAYARHRTIEFRQHSGTVNAVKIENWVRFLLAFIEASKGQNVQVELRENTMYQAPARSYGRRNRRNTAGLRRNSMDRKLDAVILAFRAAPSQRLSLAQIAAAGGWSLASVPPYITRLRQERGCQLRKIRATGEYVLIGNSGRLSSDTSPQSETTPASPAVAVETQRAARRVIGVAHIAEDSVFRGIPEEVVSYFEERAAELGEMNNNNNGAPRRR